MLDADQTLAQSIAEQQHDKRTLKKTQGKPAEI